MNKNPAKKTFAALAGMSVVGLGLVLALGHTSVAAQQSRELERRLAAAKTVSCKFSTAATVAWNSDAPAAAIEASEHESTYHDINVDEGTAEAGSIYGDSFISVRYSSGYLHFMQISDVGPLWITTIFPQAVSNGRLKAVYTRLEYAATTLPGFATRPAMYFGDCEVTS